MVVNVEAVTIAVSHHYVSPVGLSSTLRLLRDSPHEVSGLDRGLAPRDKDGAAHPDAAAEDHRRRSAVGTQVHDALVAALHKQRPDVLTQAEEELRAPSNCATDQQQPQQRLKKRKVVASSFKALLGEKQKGGAEQQGGGFAFSFNFGA